MTSAPAAEQAPLSVPDYDGACISNVVPALLRCSGSSVATNDEAPWWLPEVVRDARQVVLLVLDGVGWVQLLDRPHVAPFLSAMVGGPITSVAPTTTATALMSIVTGSPPAAHGVVGYRVRASEAGVLNVLRWTVAGGDARETVPPKSFADGIAFPGARGPVPVVTRAEFARTGFSSALRIDRMVGWHAASSISVEVGSLLAAGEPFVYAYYDGVDRIAHAWGLGAHYDAELAAADQLVAQVAAVLPSGAALVVTSDHGQVEVGDRVVALDPAVLGATSLVSGEGRFLWLHALPGRLDELVGRCRSLYGAFATVVTRDEVVDAGWFGGPLSDAVAWRVGDVGLIARAPIAFLDPTDPGSASLRCRHGSLTPDELLVPLVAVGSSA